MIHVISTGRNAPTKPVCKASVASQDGVEFRHVYVEAEKTALDPGDVEGFGPRGPRLVIENQRAAIRDIPFGDIVVLLDGDDWLAHRKVLARIQKEHDAGAWVTYGSFQTSDGAVYKCPPYETDEPRKEPWKASHLKTFRAGLWHRIAQDALEYNCQVIAGAYDQLVMHPILEMAGRDRTRAIQEILCIYNFANSLQVNGTDDQRTREERAAAIIRAKPRYPRKENLDPRTDVVRAGVTVNRIGG